MNSLGAANICVIGLGYVGLPLAVALSKKFKTTGFDIDVNRVSEISNGITPPSQGTHFLSVKSLIL